MSDSKLIRFFAKHPDTAEMAYTEFSHVKGSPQMTPAHFYKMRKRFKEEYEVEEKFKHSSGLKKEKIMEYLQDLLKKEGKSAVEKMDYDSFCEQTKMDVTQEWFRRTTKKFLQRIDEEPVTETTPPDIIPMNAILMAKIRELKALLTQLGYSNIRIIAVRKVDVEL